MAEGRIDPAQIATAQRANARELATLATELTTIGVSVLNSAQNGRRDAEITRLSTEGQLALRQRIAERTVTAENAGDFTSLVEQVQQDADEISSRLLGDVTDTRILESFEMSFGGLRNQLVGMVISNIPGQQRRANRLSIDRSLEMIKMASLQDPLDMREMYEEQITDILERAGEVGTYSKVDAANMAKENIRLLRTSRMEELISINPELALTLLDNNSFEFSPRDKRMLTARAAGGVNERAQAENTAIKAANMAATDNYLSKFNQVVLGMPFSIAEARAIRDSLPTQGLQQSLDVVTNEQAKFRAFALAPPSVRERELNMMRLTARTGPELVRVNELDRIHSFNSSKVASDPFGFAQAQGIIPGAAALNLDADLAPQLTRRIQSASLASVTYEVQVPPVTSTELNAITSAYTGGSVSRRRDLLGQITRGLGITNAQPLFAKLSESNDPINQKMAFYGGLLFENKVGLVDNLLRGDAIPDGQSSAADVRRFRTLLSRDQIPNYADPRHEEQVIEAIRTYAKAALGAAIPGVEPRSSSSLGRPDTQAVNRALQEVVGTTIVWNGDRIQPPPIAMTEARFMDLINNITEDQIASLGGMAGIDRSKWKQVLSMSTLRSTGPYAYEVRVMQSINSAQERVLVRKGSGEPFILDLGLVLTAQMEGEELAELSKLFDPIIRRSNDG